jgi:hypothetical protein
MLTTGSCETMGLKACGGCGTAMPFDNRFCRRCGLAQPSGDSDAAAPAFDRCADLTAIGPEQISPIVTARVTRREGLRPVSGPLVSSVLRELANTCPTRPKGLVALMASLPVLLLIIFLSPFDAYNAVKTLVGESNNI